MSYICKVIMVNFGQLTPNLVQWCIGSHRGHYRNYEVIGVATLMLWPFYGRLWLYYEIGHTIFEKKANNINFWNRLRSKFMPIRMRDLRD